MAEPSGITATEPAVTAVAAATTDGRIVDSLTAPPRTGGPAGRAQSGVTMTALK